MNEYIVLFAWIVRSLVINTALSLLFSGISIISIPPRKEDSEFVNREIFSTTDFSVIFLVFFVYSIQIAIFSILISQIFTKSKFIS